MVLAGERKKWIKKYRKREEYAKPRTGWERLSYFKIGLTTMAATQKLLSGMPLVLFEKKKELIRLWNSILPEPGQPSAQLSKLIRPTECRKTQHSISRWHRTVHIPWLVDSYDTHKGKRWLNSNPQTTGENHGALLITCIAVRLFFLYVLCNCIPTNHMWSYKYKIYMVSPCKPHMGTPR